jgi:hypothetical protein
LSEPFRISASTTDPCNPWGWGTLADRAAKAAGITVSGWDHIVYVFPRTSCTYSGIGNVNGPRSVNNGYCGWKDIIAHELGHNLGLEHAATLAYEYGEYSDVMGAGLGPLRQVNAPHKIEMGWIDPNQVIDVIADGAFTIAPLELVAAATGGVPQVLRFPKADTSENYFLSYRQPIGYDTRVLTSFTAWATGVAIHRHSGYGNTYDLATLTDLATFDDPVNGVRVKQLSHDAYGVTVQVDRRGDGDDPVARQGRWADPDGRAVQRARPCVVCARHGR